MVRYKRWKICVTTIKAWLMTIHCQPSYKYSIKHTTNHTWLPSTGECVHMIKCKLLGTDGWFAFLNLSKIRCGSFLMSIMQTWVHYTFIAHTHGHILLGLSLSLTNYQIWKVCDKQQENHRNDIHTQSLYIVCSKWNVHMATDSSST